MKSLLNICALALCTLLLLCGCSTEKIRHEEILPTEIDTQLSCDSIEEIAWVYSNAETAYLMPLEDYSWEREYSPEYIVIHFTSAVVEHRDDPFAEEHLRGLFIDNGVSVNYIILRDGTVKCYIPEDRAAWHAGKGEIVGNNKYTNAMNRYSIGIEIAAIGSKDDMSIYLTPDEYDALNISHIGFTEEQYKSLKLLVDDLCLRYGIPLDREHVIGHEDYSPTKTDPGELFDWERILPVIQK